MTKIEKRKIFGLVIVLVGIMIFMTPYIQILKSNYDTKTETEIYQKNLENINPKKSKELEKSIEKYNKSVVENDSIMVDPFSVENYETKNDILKFKDDIYGFVVIPRLGEKLPLYLGASEENLSKGLAHIDGTSLPVGGNNSRSVIAGHRGYYRRMMLRYLDKVKKGDMLYIYSFGKRLEYRAFSSEEIFPSEKDKLNIMENEDVVTLLTCTPYPTNRKRLLVNFRRVNASKYFGHKSEKNYQNKLVEDIDRDLKKQSVDKDVNAKKRALNFTAIASFIIAIGLIIKIIFIIYSARIREKK